MGSWCHDRLRDALGWRAMLVSGGGRGGEGKDLVRKGGGDPGDRPQITISVDPHPSCPFSPYHPRWSFFCGLAPPFLTRPPHCHKCEHSPPPRPDGAARALPAAACQRGSFPPAVPLRYNAGPAAGLRTTSAARPRVPVAALQGGSTTTSEWGSEDVPTPPRSWREWCESPPIKLLSPPPYHAQAGAPLAKAPPCAPPFHPVHTFPSFHTCRPRPCCSRPNQLMLAATARDRASTITRRRGRKRGRAKP